MPRINLEGVMKSFATPDGKSVAAVDGISLAVEDRELLAIVGPSGSGKTTLLRLVAGLEIPDHGRISFGDQNVTWQPPQERDVAMVFQSHALFPHFTAFENIAFGLKLRGTPADEIATRVRETAALLGVSHCLDRPPGKLSGGERQRVALGRALVREPKVLLLDEPFSNLDEPLRAQMRSEIPALRARFNPTMIFVTHDQEEALALGDRVAVMRKGTIQQVGPPREIYERPANRFLASFIGSPAMNLFHGAVAQRAGHLVFIGAETAPEVTLPQFVLEIGAARADWFGSNVGRQILLGFRPENIALASDKPGANPTNTLEATVKTVQFRGAEMLCHLSAGGRGLVIRTTPNHNLQPDQTVRLSFDFQRARVFDAATGVAII
jgi:multiple sugar transport system ATP-binding protein